MHLFSPQLGLLKFCIWVSYGTEAISQLLEAFPENKGWNKVVSVLRQGRRKVPDIRDNPHNATCTGTYWDK